MKEHHLASLLNYRASRRKLLIAAGVAAFLPFLEACRSPKTANPAFNNETNQSENHLDFNFLREKGEGYWYTSEILIAGEAMQKAPGDNVRKNGRWLQLVTIEPKILQETSKYLMGPVPIDTRDTINILGKPTLATTTFTPYSPNLIYTEITINPRVLEGSNEVIALFLAKELQTIKAAAGSSKDHQNLIGAQSEYDFWRTIAAQDKNQAVDQMTLILLDGRAYWEVINDYQAVLQSLGGDYRKLNQIDQILLGSFEKLAKSALDSELLIEENGQWLQNSQIPHPGYLDNVWIKQLFKLYGIPPSAYS